MCEAPPIKRRSFSLTPHKHLYLWSDHHIKGAQWCHNSNMSIVSNREKWLVHLKLTSNQSRYVSQDNYEKHGPDPRITLPLYYHILLDAQLSFNFQNKRKLQTEVDYKVPSLGSKSRKNLVFFQPHEPICELSCFPQNHISISSEFIW